MGSMAGFEQLEQKPDCEVEELCVDYSDSAIKTMLELNEIDYPIQKGEHFFNFAPIDWENLPLVIARNFRQRPPDFVYSNDEKGTINKYFDKEMIPMFENIRDDEYSDKYPTAFKKLKEKFPALSNQTNKKIVELLLRPEMRMNINEFYEHLILSSYIAGQSLDSLDEGNFKKEILAQIRSEIGDPQESDKEIINRLVGLTLCHDLGKLEDIRIWATNRKVNGSGYRMIQNHTKLGPQIINMIENKLMPTLNDNPEAKENFKRTMGVLKYVNEFHHASNPFSSKRYPECDLEKIPLYLHLIGFADRMAAGTINHLSKVSGNENTRGYQLLKNEIKDTKQIQLESIIDIYKFSRDNRSNLNQEGTAFLSDEELETKTVQDIELLEQNVFDLKIPNQKFPTFISNQIKAYQLFPTYLANQINAYKIVALSSKKILGTKSETEGPLNVQNQIADFLIKNNIKIIPNGLFYKMIKNGAEPLAQVQA